MYMLLFFDINYHVEIKGGLKFEVGIGIGIGNTDSYVPALKLVSVSKFKMWYRPAL